MRPVFLLTFFLPLAAYAEGRVVAVLDGGDLLIELPATDAAAPGNTLVLSRTLPSARGDAAYRAHGTPVEIGRATVTGGGPGLVIARSVSGPPGAIPDGLDESGADPDSPQVGDLARLDPAWVDRRLRPEVRFAAKDLWEPGSRTLSAQGSALWRTWAASVRRVEGPVRIELHVELPGLPAEGADAARERSAARDAPFGAVPGATVFPASGLDGGLGADAVEAPPADELFVIDARGAVTHYVDPVSLSLRRGDDIAARLLALGVDHADITVAVVPHGRRDGREVDGYATVGDELVLLVEGISLSEPTAPRPASVPAPRPERLTRH